MKALLWNSKEIVIDEIVKPQLSGDDSLVRVKLAGICNTDLEIIKGFMQFEGVLGHEFVGEVEESNNSSLIGKRVVCDINCACKKCHICLAGDFHHCQNRGVIGILNRNGAFTEYITVPTSNLHTVPENVSDEKAVLAEPIAAALEIIEQLQPQKNISACVIGDGKLGLIIATTLSHYGLRVTLVGRHPEREKIFETLNINFCSQLPQNTFPLVVEASGNPAGFSQFIEIVEPRGTMVLKSTYVDSFKFNPASIVINEINIIGSRCGPMDKAVALLNSNAVDFGFLIDRTYPLDEGQEAIKRASKRGVLKVLLKCS